MADQTLTPGADTAPAGDVTEGGAEDQAAPGPERHSDRMEALRNADDSKLAEMLAEAPGMVPGDDELEEENEDEDNEDPGEVSSTDEPGDDVRDEQDGDTGDDEELGESEDAGDEEGEGDLADEFTLEELEEAGFTLVSLPARHADDEDIRVPIDPQILEELGMDAEEVTQRFAQLRNGYARRQEAEAIVAEVEEDRAELDAIQVELESDPAGFIMGAVSPKLRPQIAEELILQLDDEAFARIAQKVQSWSRKPDARVTEATKTENARLKQEKTSRTAARTQAAVKAQVRDIGKAIRSLIPDTMKETTSARFIQIAATELQKHVKENKIDTLDPSEVPGLLADFGVLEDFNVSVNGDASSTSSSDDPKPRKKRKDADKASSSSASDGKKKKDVRDRMRRRKRATSTPAGAGSAAASGFVKVAGENHKDRMARLKKHLGVK